MSDQQGIEYVTKAIGTGALTKPMLDILSVKELIDSVCPIAPQGDSSWGTVASVLIDNRLSLEPKPLYEIADWAEDRGTEIMYSIAPEKLTDDRIGAMLTAESCLSSFRRNPSQS